MRVLIYLVPISLALGTVGFIAFLWTLRTRQYEDLSGAARRILEEDDDRPLSPGAPAAAPAPNADPAPR